MLYLFILISLQLCVLNKTNLKTFNLQGFKVRHGTQERVFRLEFMSNQEFTDPEYHKWVEATNATGIEMPTKSRIEQKQADIKEAISYEFNEQDVERIVSTLEIDR